MQREGEQLELGTNEMRRILLTFWNRKFLAPLSYSFVTQLTAQLTISTIVTAGGPCPTMSLCTPTSLVPIHSVYTVSLGFKLIVPLVT